MAPSCACSIFETHVLSLFGFYPHRCMDCQHRFLARAGSFSTELRVRVVTAPPWARTVMLIIFGLTAGLVVAAVIAGLNRTTEGPAEPTRQELKDALKK